MKLSQKINWIVTVILIILIELLFLLLFYRFWSDPVRTKTYHRTETAVTVRPEVTKENVEKELLKSCTRLDSTAVQEAGMPEYTEGFYNADDNLVWYLLAPSEEKTARSCMDAVEKDWSRTGTVNTEVDYRHEAVKSIGTDSMAGIATRYHSVVLVGISRDGKHASSIRTVMEKVGLIYESH